MMRLPIALALLWPWMAPACADSILFVGNSFTYGALSPVQGYRADSVTDLNGTGTGGVPALFKAFTEQAHLGYTVSLETVGGANLDLHLEQKRALLERAWDHVVLQPYSTLDAEHPGDDALIVRDAARFTAMLQAQNARVDVRLEATWSRADQTWLPTGHWQGKPITQMAIDIRAADEHARAHCAGIRGVIPVGEAWNRAIEGGIATANPYADITPGQLNLWASDNYHGSTQGYYLAALVIYGSITGQDPRALGSQERAAADLGLTPAQAQALQAVAWQTLAAPSQH